MKTSVLLIFFLMVIATGIYSCSKSKTDIPCAVSTDTVNTYTKTVKPIMDFYCAYGGCHDAGSAASGIVLEDFASTKSAAVNQSNFFCVIDWTCGPKMPQGASQPLADSLINQIKAWRNNCFAE